MSSFLTSSIGRKVVMAITGAMLIGFVIAHLLGNLQIFAGKEAFNDYAAYLQSLGPLLWVARGGLLLAFLLHVVTAISLTKTNMAARPSGYVHQNSVQLSFGSKYMMESGMLILIFVIVHLLHFTLGKIQPENYGLVDYTGRHDVYQMVINSFSNVYYSLGYVACMLLLGTHLSHAVQSVFQTLGLTNDKSRVCLRQMSLVFGWAVALGYMLIPLSVLSGFVGSPVGGV